MLAISSKVAAGRWRTTASTAASWKEIAGLLPGRLPMPLPSPYLEGFDLVRSGYGNGGVSELLLGPLVAGRIHPLLPRDPAVQDAPCCSSPPGLCRPFRTASATASPGRALRRAAARPPAGRLFRLLDEDQLWDPLPASRLPLGIRLHGKAGARPGTAEPCRANRRSGSPGDLSALSAPRHTQHPRLLQRPGQKSGRPHPPRLQHRLGGRD